jgi:hypothetical protein
MIEISQFEGTGSEGECRARGGDDEQGFTHMATFSVDKEDKTNDNVGTTITQI